MAEEKKTYKFVCTVCGYEVEVDTPELPEDYVCPVCGVGPDQFEENGSTCYRSRQFKTVRQKISICNI